MSFNFLLAKAHSFKGAEKQNADLDLDREFDSLLCMNLVIRINLATVIHVRKAKFLQSMAAVLTAF